MTKNSGPARIAADFQQAWNTHDMAAFALLFHPDATFVNRFAAYARGAEAIVAGHSGIHASIYRDSTLAIDPPDIDMISDDAAVLHMWTRLHVGAAHPAGPHQLDTLIMAVATRWGMAHPGGGECDPGQSGNRRPGFAARFLIRMMARLDRAIQGSKLSL